jgi:predicted DCC family thiol-disulfide oxidoreductase YuxK
MQNNNYVLIYDEGCPLCVAYTGWFVKTGFLQPEERKSFTEAGEQWLKLSNFERSRNEIPFLNIKTGETLYGIDALLEILNRKIPFIKTIGNVAPVKYLLLRLYKLISFNRKVITGNKTKFNCVDCTPDFNLFYRISFMLLSLVFITALLFPLHGVAFSKIPFYQLSILQLQVIHFSIVATNMFIAYLVRGKKGIEYLGQMNMLALSAILLTIPLLMANQLINFSYQWDVVYLSLISTLMVFDYFRRIDFADLKQNGTIVTVNLLTFITLIFFLL